MLSIRDQIRLRVGQTTQCSLNNSAIILDWRIIFNVVQQGQVGLNVSLVCDPLD
jgi:hypothetical protein